MATMAQKPPKPWEVAGGAPESGTATQQAAGGGMMNTAAAPAGMNSGMNSTMGSANPSMYSGMGMGMGMSPFNSYSMYSSPSCVDGRGRVEWLRGH